MSINPPTVPSCVAALSLCTAMHDKLLHVVIALSFLLGVLLTTFSMLLLFLCFRREGAIPSEEGKSTVSEPVNEHYEEKLDTGNVSKNEKASVLPSPLQSVPPSSWEVKGAIEDDISVHAFSDDGQCPCSEPVIVPHCSPLRPSSAAPLAATSVDDFDQGQDHVFHPQVRTLVEEGSFTKDAVRHLKPIAPRPDAVIAGYNPILDEIRPETMDTYLLNYRILFVIDDSTSMKGHWSETSNALSEIAQYALRYHSDAVDIRFFNSRYQKCGVQGKDQVMDIFNSVSRSFGTPTGRVLEEVLNEQLDRLDGAEQRGTYSSERPLDIIILTDGVPDLDSPPAPVIEEAARRLKATGHHQNWIGIQFVQIGDNPYAEPTLLSLIDCANNNDMVDTISYSFYKDEGGGKLSPEILERIILGGLHPNLRSYYNQFRRKVNAVTSQMIY